MAALHPICEGTIADGILSTSEIGKTITRGCGFDVLFFKKGWDSVQLGC